MKRRHILLPTSIIEELNKLAETKQLSFGELIRQAVNEFLKKQK